MKIGVIGGGAWGTALAQVAAHEGRDVILWAREPAVVDSINATHANALFLAGVALSPTIRATGDLGALANMDAILVVAPAQHVGSVLAAAPIGGIPLVLCAKGIEAGSKRLVGEVARAVHPDAPIAVLSGPTFAHEVAAGLPTAVTLACEDEALGEALATRLAARHFRTYASTDVAGAEIGGAVKNVLAIGCGVVEGRARPERTCGADRARFCRDDAVRACARRPRGDARRAVGAWRSRAHLFLDEFAQFLAWRRSRARRGRRRVAG
jgi:glycerol-3-phosphate dehydrogenase (NAD(P)+)